MHTTGLFDVLKDSNIFGVFIFQEEGKIVFANKRFAEILGCSSADEILGKNMLEFIPKDLSNLEEIKDIIRRRTQGEVFPVELKNHLFLSKTKAYIPVSVFAYTIDYNGKPSGFVLVLDKTQEISYQKLFFALSQINQLIVKTESEEELLREVCNILVDKIGYTSCAIGYIDETSKLFIQKYTRSNTKEKEEALRSLTIGVDPSTPYGSGSVSQAYHTKKIAIIEDVLKRTHMSYWQDYYSHLNIHSVCSIPLMKNNKVKYILYLNDTTPNSFSKDYLHLLEEIQMDLSFALDKIEAQKSITLLNKALDKSHEWAVITDKEGTILDANQAVCDISGYTKSELIGKNPRIFKSGYHDKEFYKKLWGNILSGQTCSCRFINKAKDGSIFYLDSIIVPIIYNNEIYRFIDLSRDVTKQVQYEKTLELSNRIYNTLYELTNLSISVKSKDEFLEKLPDVLVKYLEFDLAYVVLEKDSKLNIVSKCTKDQKYNEYLEKAKDFIQNITYFKNMPTHVHTPLLKSLKQQNVYMINEIDSHGFCPIEKITTAYGFNSCCALSISEQNKIIGNVVLISTQKNLFDAKTYKLLKTVSSQISFVLDRFEEQKFSQMTQLAVDSGFEFVIITDENFNIVYASDKALSISEYTKEELIGAHHSIFSSKTHTKEFVKHFYKTLKSGLPYSNFMKYKIKSGKILDFYVNIIPFKQDGKITNYISIGKLINEKDTVEQLERILYTDPITSLPNYRSFQESLTRFLERALPENTLGAVAIINPIAFSSINQAFGFEKANEILRLIGERLKNTLYSYDIIAKLESDRFGVVIKDLKKEEDLLVIVYNLLSNLSKPYTVENQSISLSFNIGLSLTPKDGTTANELIDKANTALQDAREKGENQIGFFRKEIEDKALDKLKLKADLELAVLNKEFVPFYQPYVDKNKHIKGAEALMRWIKDNKIVPPVEFIESLEETNLIVDAENQLIEKVLKDLQIIQKQKKDISISINLSALSLRQRNLTRSLSSLLNYHQINPSLLKIEIIERVFFKDFAYIKSLIEELKELGVHFSIDDFGTHYSSLSYLSELDVSFLKIDISFVRKLQTDPKTKNIVSAIIYLAHALGIETIAEGVETIEQFEILKELECDYFQGFLFFKPMPRKEFLRVVDV
jgi:diguanylate cyclase (GGDEF)-like protein/PAS domain S-box-containing protein